MAADLFVPGLIRIEVAPPAGTYALLGYSRDGIHIRETLRQRPVYGDEGGGSDGVPVDWIFLGQWHDVRFELYRFDGDVLAGVLKVLSTNADKTRDKTFDAGHLIRQSGDYFKLKLFTENRISTAAPAFKREYPVAVLTGSPEYPVGVNEMVTMLEFTCYPNSSGVLFTVPA
ncbi:MAG: hypothetical protein Kow0040_17380 [Thermogutta sp.]